MGIKRELIDWLDDKNLNVFVTVTLKQSELAPDKSGFYKHRPISPEDIRKTGWLIRDRVSKAVFGTRRYQNKSIPPFLVFAEGDALKRQHLHILSNKPENLSEADYSDLFNSTAKKFSWVYDEIKILPISYNSAKSVISYSLKTGFDAFIPEASFIPQYA